jgi:hypothetical protein
MATWRSTVLPRASFLAHQEHAVFLMPMLSGQANNWDGALVFGASS